MMRYGLLSIEMILIATGKGLVRLLPRIGRAKDLQRNYSTKPLPADLAGLIPTLEDLGLGSGDNGTSSSQLLPHDEANDSPRSNVRRC